MKAQGVSDFGSSIDTIRKLTTEYQLIFLQETWLYPDDFSIVSRISESYESFSISSLSLDDRLIAGRPHGGMSVLWNKSLSNAIKILMYLLQCLMQVKHLIE